ncbi:type II toxin-antitoxin system HicB family antitoxin [Candidatus Curtissbacteria bacterium]|nr:type II toxin-antitoxin system HicB family antitoxin [Candidatus Curtissbacteria bacterium]
MHFVERSAEKVTLLIDEYNGILLSVMEKFVLNYRVIVEPDKRTGTNESCFTAYCPTLGIADDGDTIDEALVNMKEGIQCYIEALIKGGEEIPHPDNLREGIVSGVTVQVTGKPPKLNI